MDMNKTRVDEIVTQWESAREKGETPALEDLCADCPDLLTVVEDRIRAIKRHEANQRTLHGEETVSADPLTTSELHVDSALQNLKFLAQGGLGSVYRATDKQLFREVAVKFIQHRFSTIAESRQQFLLEAEVTGRLEHPGIVPLYGFGETSDGRMFYVMRYIEGQTLDQAIAEYHQQNPKRFKEHFGFHKLLHHFVSVCQTIAYAHNRGIVHRDIKPANVMLGRYGETLVVDWGLAVPVTREGPFKKSGEGTLMLGSGSRDSSSHSRAGTPGYMSPEQSDGMPPTPAADIYSLGATLYKILTGKTQLEGVKLEEFKDRLHRGEIDSPRKVASHVPRELDAICQKAMSLLPRNRYVTALDLAQDVERFLADEPVSVFRESKWAKWSRWARRNRTAVSVSLFGLAGILLLSLLSAFGFAHLAQSEGEAHRKAVAAQLEAEKSRKENLQTSALFAARSIANEIDLRWRVLELEALSPTLRELLEKLNQAPDDVAAKDKLKNWLWECYQSNSVAVQCHSWIVFAKDGTMLARASAFPARANMLGKKFANRDYFHGQGHDFEEEETLAKVKGPHEKAAHLSAVIRSATTGTLMVCLSSAVFDRAENMPNRRSIGILCMALELGQFSYQGMDLLLADTREDRLEKVPRQGLVLHHDSLGALSEGRAFPRLDEKAIKVALDMRSLRKNARFASSLVVPESLVEDFRNPLASADAAPAQAACEPILIKGRSRDLADTGWVVFIEDHARKRTKE